MKILFRLIKFVIFGIPTIAMITFALLYFKPWIVKYKNKSEVKTIEIYSTKEDYNKSINPRILPTTSNDTFMKFAGYVEFSRKIIKDTSDPIGYIKIIKSDNSYDVITNKYILYYDFTTKKESKTYIKIKDAEFNVLYKFNN